MKINPQSTPAPKPTIFNPTILFLIFGLLIGATYCIAIPYGAGFDEEAHMVRIYDLSGNNIFPNRNPPTYKHTLIYREFHDLSYQRRDFQTPAFDMFTPESLSQKLSRTEESVLYGYTTNSIYSPVIFLPQALIAKVAWRNLDLPIFPTIIIMRLAGLLLYILLTSLAIYLLPHAKWVLAALALSPMALFQAATLSADGYLASFSFLFISLCLYIYIKAPSIKVGWVWALVAVTVLLGGAKLGAVILLPLLLLPIIKLPAKKWGLLLAVGGIVSIGFNLGWTALAIPTSRFDGDSSDLLSLVLARPDQFLLTFAQSFSTSFNLYFRNWMASYGYWVADVPAPVYWFYSLLLVLTVLLVEPAAEKFPVKARLFLLGMFFLSSASVVGMYFSLHYTPGVITELRQGRYLVPYVPLLLIPACGLIPIFLERWRKLVEVLAVACLLVALAYYSFGLYATYYTICGYPAYAGGKCVLPVYKNLEIAQMPEIKVNATTSLSQRFTSECTGLESVHVILGSIPQASTATLRFSLFDASRNKLASKEIPPSEIKLRQYLTLPVSSASGIKGESYEIRLEAPSLTAPNGFGAIFQPQPLLTSGELFIADEWSRGDLIFHYVCTAP